jgi:succinylglutamate desuccinylase
MKNQSEKQLSNFLKRNTNECMSLELHPQGDLTIISKTQINLCSVTLLKGRIYKFGGISEKFYDKMVDRYHMKN